MFGHLRSFKGWIQTEACVIPSYHGMLIRGTKKLSLSRLVRDRMLRRRLPEGSRESSLCVAGVLDDPPGFPYTPPGIDVLEGGKLTSNNVTGSSK